MSIHTDKKDFKCDLCEAAFRTKGSLIRHNRRHTGMLLYMITVFICCFVPSYIKDPLLDDSVEVVKSNTVKKYLNFSDERPYQCNQCGLSFRESGALTRHLKSLTPCTEKIRYSQCKEILFSKDGICTGKKTTLIYYGLFLFVPFCSFLMLWCRPTNCAIDVL